MKMGLITAISAIGLYPMEAQLGNYQEADVRAALADGLSALPDSLAMRRIADRLRCPGVRRSGPA